MCTFLLIRHGSHDYLDKRIVSWMPGVHINEEGRAQAQRLGETLAGSGVAALYSSPLERAIETAAPIARRLGLEIHTRDALGEVRFGEWTNLDFDTLNQDPRWHAFNRFRSGIRAPGGELMLEVQTRMVAEMERLRGEHAERTVAIVSHGDVIKAAVMHYLAMPLDLLQRIEISPASVSVIRVSDRGAKVLRVNAVGGSIL